MIRKKYYPPIKKRVATRIRTVRMQASLSQEALADHAGINRSYISHVESGAKNLTIETLGKILKGLDLTFLDFFQEF